MEIKICGIRRDEDIAAVNKYKPDYIGFILSPGYRRSVTVQTAAELCKKLDRGIKTVGVFVDALQDEVEKAADTIGLFAVQLHGKENDEYIESLNVKCEIWKAVQVRNGADIDDIKGVSRILLDKYDEHRAGGTGKAFERSEVGRIKAKSPVILAGGLDSKNVLDRIKMFKPDGVDVSSSVETDGFKDENKIEEFIYKVRAWENEQNR